MPAKKAAEYPGGLKRSKKKWKPQNPIKTSEPALLPYSGGSHEIHTSLANISPCNHAISNSPAKNGRR